MLGDERPETGSGSGASGADGNAGTTESPRRGRPPRSVDPVVPEIPANQNFTMAQMLEIVAKMGAEMRKPSDREQQKIDKEDAQVRRNQAERAQLAKSEMDRKEARKIGCPHTITHPATKVTWHRWVAQVHTPSHRKPYFTPICQECWTQLPEIAATPAMLTDGVQLDKYQSLTRETLENWAKLTPAQ